MSEISKWNYWLSDAASRLIFRVFSALFIPVTAACAFISGGNIVVLTGLAFVLAAINFLSGNTAKEARAKEGKARHREMTILALILTGQVMLVNAALSGHPWQLDSHMIYFAMLAIVATLRSVPALLACAGVIAVHHLSLGLLLPSLVYPSSDFVANVTRTLFHAGVVVVETLTLARMIIMIDMKEQAQQSAQEAELKAAQDAATRNLKAREQAAMSAVHVLADQLRKVAAGNLLARIDQDMPTEFGDLRGDFNKAIDSLRDVMLHNTDMADGFAKEAELVASTSSLMAQELEKHASEVNAAAEGLRALTSSVAQTAKDVSEVDGAFVRAKEKAGHGAEVVSTAVDTINSIKASSDEISKIIQVIEDISFQTNLLALNAGVEAARAGEHGRGFAVVASEVRALSVRTSEAAREVKDLITSSQGLVAGGVKSVGAAGDVLAEMVADVQRASTLTSGLADQTGEQSAALEDMARAIDAIDSGLQHYATETGDLSATGDRVAEAANELRASLTRFELGGSATASGAKAA